MLYFATMPPLHRPDSPDRHPLRQVGYEAGSNGEPLPPACMNLLDSELVPVLHRYAAEVPDSPSCLELLFHVIDR